MSWIRNGGSFQLLESPEKNIHSPGTLIHSRNLSELRVKPCFWILNHDLSILNPYVRLVFYCVLSFLLSKIRGWFRRFAVVCDMSGAGTNVRASRDGCTSILYEEDASMFTAGLFQWRRGYPKAVNIEARVGFLLDFFSVFHRFCLIESRSISSRIAKQLNVCTSRSARWSWWRSHYKQLWIAWVVIMVVLAPLFL